MLYSYESESLRHNRTFVKLALANPDAHGMILDVLHLQLVSDDLLGDREVILAAVKVTGAALEYASESLCNDREIVFTAVQTAGYALEYASEALCNDREIVLAAVKENGRALEYASAELKNDREIVLAAVKQQGHALQFASADLRNNREVVSVAIPSCWPALMYTSLDLQNDREMILASIQSYNQSYAPNFPTRKHWDDRCGETFRNRVQQSINVLRDRKAREERVSFDDLDSIVKYTAQWKRNICEKVWLVSKSFCGEIKGLVLEFAGLGIEHQQACEVQYCAPIISADALTDRPCFARARDIRRRQYQPPSPDESESDSD